MRSYASFSDVSKIYHSGEVKTPALTNASFEVEKGEFCVIVGPSGAGKTTILNILGGMDTPSGGQVFIDGQEISAFGERALTSYRRYDVGFVFQFYNLVQNLTARENVELASEICKDPLDAAEMLERVGLAHRLDNFPAAEAQLASAQETLSAGWAGYHTARAEADKAYQKAKTRLNEGEAELRTRRNQLNSLSPPTWYLQNRSSNPGYSGFESDARRIDSIAMIFPVFFFLVTALVCLTTMTRMVEDHRTQIGTLKALGFSGGSIAAKYLLYAVFTSLSGAVAGVLIGSWVFPVTIWRAYQILYLMPALQVELSPLYAPLSILVSVLCCTLATYAACYGELRSMPSQLMRPKAPKPGRRIFLEHLPALWHRLSFSWKVAARNLFRYKKRLFMTIIGVAGCAGSTWPSPSSRPSNPHFHIRGQMCILDEDVFQKPGGRIPSCQPPFPSGGFHVRRNRGKKICPAQRNPGDGGRFP